MYITCNWDFEQSGLVEVRNVGPWIVYFCRNCCQYTHAIHEEHGTANVIVNTGIITSVDKVRKLKAYPQWSPVFGIVIRYKPSDSDPLELPCDSAVAQLSRSQRMALTRLGQQLEERVQSESTAVEEKIRVFTEKQHQLFEQFKEKAHAEHKVLARLICSNEESGELAKNMETLPDTSEITTTDTTTDTLAQSIDSESPDATDNNRFKKNSKKLDAAKKHPD